MRGSQFTKKGREHENDLALRIRSDGGSALRATGGCTTDDRLSAGQVMQSSSPSGKQVTCVPLPDVGAEAAARASADADLSARISALSETDIVGRWSVTGCDGLPAVHERVQCADLQSEHPFGRIGKHDRVARLGGTFIGTRTFYAGGTGRSVGTTHSMTFPALNYFSTGPNTFATSPGFAGAASVATLDAAFTWTIRSDGTLLIDDDNAIAQPFTAPPSMLGQTVTIENVPSYAGYIGKDKRTIVLDAQRHGDRDQRSEGCERKPAQPHAALLRALARAIAAAELDTVGFSQKRKRVRLHGRARFLAHPLHDVARGDGAVGADVIRRRLRAICRNTGRPIFIELSKYSVFTPHVPSWPEQRSTAVTCVPGTISSVSRVFCPCSARASGRGCGSEILPSGCLKSVFSRPSCLRSTKYSNGSNIASRTALDVGVVRDT